MSLEVAVITLFPEMFSALDFGVIGRGIKQDIVQLSYFNPRDFSTNIHKNIDDKPYGGGAGMVMQVQPLRAAIKAAKQQLGEKSLVIYLSPQGIAVSQPLLQHYDNKHGKYILICGRYEGIDQRIIDHDVDLELCIGDFVVSGGELPAMLLIDALARLQDGVLGHADSNKYESFTNGLLEHPQYTRPEEIDGQRVPGVLLSGDHDAIAKYRRKQALSNTWQKRPDLIKSVSLSKLQREWIKEF